MTRRLKLVAFFLPLLGLALIMPPLVNVFSVEATIFGVPLIVAYMFAIWGGLILVAYLIQRQFPSTESEAAGKTETASPLDDSK